VTRRMAIDFQVPLITNIKVAKMLIDSLIKYPDFSKIPIDKHDCISSHNTLDIPGFIDINYSVDCDDTVALAGGVTHIAIESAHSVNDRYINYTQIVNVALVADISSLSDSPLVSVNDKMVQDVTFMSQLFQTISANCIVFADAKSSSVVSSLLFLANINRRKIHLRQVYRAIDLAMISQAKAMGIQVSCDTNPLFMYSSTASNTAMVSNDDIDVGTIWSNLDTIDCFSLGKIGQKVPQTYAVAFALLMTSAYDPTMDGFTMEDMVAMIHHNSAAILNINIPTDTYLEVDVDQILNMSRMGGSGSSEFANIKVKGTISRVVNHGKTAYSEGMCFATATDGIHVVPNLAMIAQSSSFKSSSHQTNPSQSIIVPTTPKFPPGLSIDSAVNNNSDGMLKSPAMLASRFATAAASARCMSSTVVPQTPSLKNKSLSNFHVVSVMNWSRKQLHQFFTLVGEMRTIKYSDMLQGKILVNLFYEPSTRTSCSFQAAMMRLGGKVMSVDAKTSSVSKGETVEDTVRCLESYGDVLVIRHPEKGSVEKAANVASVPVINAGDGVGEHPTQALLDIYTIREELGTVQHLNVTLVGDLKNGRTCHSLVQLLKLYNVNLTFVSHATLKMPQDIVKDLADSGINVTETTDLKKAMAKTDVLYVTRVQRERFGSEEEYNLVKDAYRITPHLLKPCKERMCILHPLPRVDEISREVDFDERAAYFRQMKYGMYVRMALLASVVLSN